MPFSEKIVRLRFSFADEKCECNDRDHGHGARCGKELVFAENNGTGNGAWQTYQAQIDGIDSTTMFSDCRIYCRECFMKTTLQKA